MDPVEVGWLYRSFVRRKKFEADLLANTVVAALSEAMGGGSAASAQTPAPLPSPQPRSARTAPPPTPDRQVVPAHQFFKILESR